MPTLHLRALTADLVSRVRAYALARGLSTPDAAADLLDAGLRARESQQTAQQARWRDVSPEARQDAARRAARARWQQ